ncbi:hypothetical protein AHAS_Ahas20G0239000 [Arachis hypogaea]
MLILFRWSHWCWFTRYTRRSMVQFRRQLDDMRVNDFIWHPYMAVVVPDDLAINLFMCSTKSLLVPFKCIEWHPTEQIRRQFVLQQLQPDPAFEIDRVAGEEADMNEPQEQPL